VVCVHKASPVSYFSKLIRALGILGATGAVGQRFILLLSEHPFLEITAVGASERSAGKKYAEAAQWRQSEPIPAAVASLIVQECRPELFEGCHVIFSGLDTAKAHEVEPAFAKLYAVFSNASAYRMDPLTPLVVPTVNLAHMSMIPAQRQQLKSEGKGFLVTNSNWYNSLLFLSICTATCTYILEE
jgi:aspartate-semialdehyde dehydrogenase